MNTILNEINQQLSTVITAVRESVVQLSNGHNSIGAGVVWNTDGLIITNAHVVHKRHLPKVTLWDGRSYSAKLLAKDKKLDLAALQAD
ncbi:MAG: hypothetical protein GY943_08895, partial [Chloroflexi bacterium]|nr:hypothetical protein [Chloroflexota bacterium]